ncbi:MAG: hypothetical protein KBA26_05575 [Candidatus Delongbacteria bacterium]|nr:hypothetical protein [Candidatus Delongbacteria bacterium]
MEPLIHPSSDDLQSYLDQPKSGAWQPIEDHLRQCPACRRELEGYRFLYRELTHDSGPVLPVDFTNRVMAQISPSPAAWTYWLGYVLSGCAIGLIIFFYHALFIKQLMLLENAAQSLKITFLSYYPFDPDLSLVIALILSATFLLDKAVAHIIHHRLHHSLSH